MLGATAAVQFLALLLEVGEAVQLRTRYDVAALSEANSPVRHVSWKDFVMLKSRVQTFTIQCLTSGSYCPSYSSLTRNAACAATCLENYPDLVPMIQVTNTGIGMPTQKSTQHSATSLKYVTSSNTDHQLYGKNQENQHTTMTFEDFISASHSSTKNQPLRTGERQILTSQSSYAENMLNESNTTTARPYYSNSTELINATDELRFTNNSPMPMQSSTNSTALLYSNSERSTTSGSQFESMLTTFSLLVTGKTQSLTSQFSNTDNILNESRTTTSRSYYNYSTQLVNATNELFFHNGTTMSGEYSANNTKLQNSTLETLTTSRTQFASVFTSATPNVTDVASISTSPTTTALNPAGVSMNTTSSLSYNNASQSSNTTSATTLSKGTTTSMANSANNSKLQDSTMESFTTAKTLFPSIVTSATTHITDVASSATSPITTAQIPASVSMYTTSRLLYSNASQSINTTSAATFSKDSQPSIESSSNNVTVQYTTPGTSVTSERNSTNNFTSSAPRVSDIAQSATNQSNSGAPLNGSTYTTSTSIYHNFTETSLKAGTNITLNGTLTTNSTPSSILSTSAVSRATDLETSAFTPFLTFSATSNTSIYAISTDANTNSTEIIVSNVTTMRLQLISNVTMKFKSWSVGDACAWAIGLDGNVYFSMFTYNRPYITGLSLQKMLTPSYGNFTTVDSGLAWAYISDAYNVTMIINALEATYSLTPSFRWYSYGIRKRTFGEENSTFCFGLSQQGELLVELVEWYNESWSPLDSPNYSCGSDLWADIAFGPSGLWALATNGTLYYFLGSRRTEPSCSGVWTALSGLFASLATARDKLVVVSQSGTVYSRLGIDSQSPTGSTWQQVNISVPVASVSISPSGLVWLASSSGQFFIANDL